MNAVDRLRSLAHLLGVAALAFVVQLPVWNRTMSLMDEGHILQFADMVSRGGELYRDATLLPLPGAFYLLSAAFDLFGPSIRVARWLVVIEFTLLSVVVFLLMQRLLSRRWAWRAVGVLLVYKVWAFPHWLMYSYSTTSLALLALALLAFVRFLDGGSRWALAGAGLATGLGVLCKQDYGAAVLVALNGVLLVAVRSGATAPAPPLRLFAWLDGAAAVVGAATALHFLHQGLFGEMLQQTLLNHLRGIASFEYTSLPSLFPLFEAQGALRTPKGIGTWAPAILFTVDWDFWRSTRFFGSVGWDLAIKTFFYAPYAIVAGGALRLWWTRAALRDPQRRPPWLRELALFAFAASLVLALNKPVDWVHVAVIYWPLLLLLLVYAHAAVQGRPRLAGWVAVASFLPALVVVLYSGRLVWGLYTRFDTPLRGERAGVYVQAREEKVIGDTVDYVVAHSQPGERVAVLPYFPLISFLAGRDAPHRAIYTFWPVAYIPDRERQIAEAIEASGTDFLIYHFTQWPQLTPMSEWAPDLFAWLASHYEMETRFSDPTWGYQLVALRRSAGAPAGAPILEPDARNAKLFVEVRGRERPVPAERRGELLETGLWPFRPVVALRPLSGEQRSVLAIPVEVPEQGASLRTAVGVHPDWWFRFPPTAVTFEIRVVSDAGRERVFSQTLAPHTDPDQRGWHEVDVSLERWAGRRIEVELCARASSPLGEDPKMGGFELPRLVAASPDGSPAGLD